MREWAKEKAISNLLLEIHNSKSISSSIIAEPHTHTHRLSFPLFVVFLLFHIHFAYILHGLSWSVVHFVVVICLAPSRDAKTHSIWFFIFHCLYGFFCTHTQKTHGWPLLVYRSASSQPLWIAHIWAGDSSVNIPQSRIMCESLFNVYVSFTIPAELSIMIFVWMLYEYYIDSTVNTPKA